MNDILEVRHLVKRFGDVTAVDDLSFRVREGELFAFLGVNGAGKSTTIHILCGQLPRDGRQCARLRCRPGRSAGAAPPEPRRGVPELCAGSGADRAGQPAQPRGTLRHPGRGVFPPPCGADGPAGVGRAAAPAPSASSRAASAAVSTSPAPCCTGRACSFWMSRRRALTRRRAVCCGRSWRACGRRRI